MNIEHYNMLPIDTILSFRICNNGNYIYKNLKTKGFKTDDNKRLIGLSDPNDSSEEIIWYRLYEVNVVNTLFDVTIIKYNDCRTKYLKGNHLKDITDLINFGSKFFYGKNEKEKEVSIPLKNVKEFYYESKYDIILL